MRALNRTLVRVLQIGVGKHGMTWLHLLRSHPLVRLAGIIDARTQTLWTVCQDLGIPGYSSLSAAVRSEEFDAVLIATPPASHYDLAIETLNYGKDMVIEKPLVLTHAEAETIRAVACARGKIVMAAQQYRFSRAARLVSEIIRQGQIGRLLHIDCVFRRDVQQLLSSNDFRFGMRNSLLFDMAIHHVDLVRSITGCEFEWASAKSENRLATLFEHETAITIRAGLQGGTNLSYSADWASEETPTSWNGSWRFEGSNGSIVWDDDPDQPTRHRITLLAQSGEPEEFEFDEPVSAPTNAMLSDFVQAVRTKETPETSIHDNLKTLEVLFACARSMGNDETISLIDQASALRKVA